MSLRQQVYKNAGAKRFTALVVAEFARQGLDVTTGPTPSSASGWDHLIVDDEGLAICTVCSILSGLPFGTLQEIVAEYIS